MTRGWGRVASRLGAWAVAVVGSFLLAMAVAPAGAAGAHPAHARLVGSTPEDGSTVRVAPDDVSIVLDAKPATVEGDPLQVYDSDGRRVDAGDAQADRGGRRLTVGLDHRLELPAGDYQIAYRVVSADSHVIAGRLSFTTRSAAAQSRDGGSGRGGRQVGTVWTPNGETSAVDAPASPDSRLTHDGPDDARPRLVAAGAAVLAALVLGLRVLRWAAPDRRARVPASWTHAPTGPSGVRHHPSGSGWDRPRRGSGAARRQRPGRRSSPVGAGLRIPRPGPDMPDVPDRPDMEAVEVARPEVASQAAAVPAIVAGHRRRPWTTNSPRRGPSTLEPTPGHDRPALGRTDPTSDWDDPAPGSGRSGGNRRVPALQSRTVADARSDPAPWYRRPPEDSTWS
jgi:methionine-rich copper-binding protein CopC